MNIFKKALIVALSIGLISVPTVTKEVEAVNITGGMTMYLKPNSNWTQSNAWFAIYLCNGSTAAKWIAMSDDDGDGYYEANIPSGRNDKNIIFCRMNPASKNLDWSNKWNQTGNLVWNGTNNLCTIKTGQWDCGQNVTWSNYIPKEVTYSVVGDFNGWNPADETYNMTPNSDKTVYTYSGLIVKDTAEFKVVRNHSWDDGSWGDGSSNFIINESGRYDITFTVSSGKVAISKYGLACSSTYTEDLGWTGIPTTIYFEPNSEWKDANAWFAAYFFEGEKYTWIKLNDLDSDGKYEVDVPSGYSTIIFCRMNPEYNDLSWDSKWNKTHDVKLEVNKNLFSITNSWSEENTGSWSTFNAGHLASRVQLSGDVEKGYALRLVGIFGLSNEETLYSTNDYDAAGFEVTLNGKTVTKDVRYLYSSLVANGYTINASTFGGDYFFVLTLNGIPQENFELSFRCYTRVGDIYEYGATRTCAFEYKTA